MITTREKIKKLGKEPRLNLGSGIDYKDSWFNVDLSEENQLGTQIHSDCSHDLDEFPYPFEDNTFDEILLNQVLEHLENPPKVIKELIRISTEGAVIIIRVPHFSDLGAYEEPTHKHFFALNSIDYMRYDCDVKKEFEHPHNKILKVISRIFTIHSFFYERFLKGVYSVKGIRWTLKVRKPLPESLGDSLNVSNGELK